MVPLPRYQHFIAALKRINFTNNPDATPSQEIMAIASMKLKDRETCQSVLAHKLIDARFKAMNEIFLQNNRLEDLKWWKGIQNPEAGIWLETTPYNDPLHFTSLQYTTALRHRYHLGSRCDCATKPFLDPYGIHVATGCGKGGFRNATHDALCHTLNQIMNYAGYSTIREERQCFGAYLEEDNHRPDITIKNPDGQHLIGSKIIIDVSVTCPLELDRHGHVKAPSRNEAVKKGSKAVARYNDKIKKCKVLERLAAENATQHNRELIPNNFGIVPFIFESTGLIHRKSLEFLERVADKATESKRLNNSNIYSFFLKRLVVCLQKSIANAIERRITSLNGHYNFDNDRNFSDAIISGC